MNVEEMLSLEDAEFGRTVQELDMKGLLWLMESLQTAMCEEQRRFEKWSFELQKCPDSMSHRKISALLCTSQRTLANLCTKHMMCCLQKSSKTSLHDICKTSGQNNEFFRNLRFFQKGSESVDIFFKECHHSTETISAPDKSHVQNVIPKALRVPKEEEQSQSLFPPTSYVGNPHVQKHSFELEEDPHRKEENPKDESEYDSKDFVVHKTHFSESTESHEEPRPYFYYAPDNELEVIPEEEEPITDAVEEGSMFPNVEYHKHRNVEHRNVEYRKVEVPPTYFTKSWHPEKLLQLLYRLDFPLHSVQQHPIHYINKGGYLEKLPSGRRKATYWNPWKTTFVQLRDGFLHCYETNPSEKPSLSITLMGGRIETLDNTLIGVDDQKGHYLVFRCLKSVDLKEWLRALHSQCTEDFLHAYTTPSLHPLPSNKKVLVIDLGSCSIRAGVLMSAPSLPQLFFPTVCAVHKTSQKKVFGMEALDPWVRAESKPLLYPLHPDQGSLDVGVVADLVRHIFRHLNVNPEEYKVQMSVPRSLSVATKLKLASLFLEEFRVPGLNLTHQAILSLHAYNATSGVVVDIGERLDVLPIIEGYIVESGVSRLPYGGQRMLHHLKQALAEKNISLMSPVESYLARYVLEELCYVAEDYEEELQRYYTQKKDFELSLSASHFFNQPTPWDEIVLDLGRFHVPEGLFSPEVWGLDQAGLHKLVYHAIQECGMDLRKEMTKSIYISGGVTLLPGLVERLELEVDRLSPSNITSKVHGSPYRYHMSYIGACQIALEDKFEDYCITKQMWKTEGNSCVKKWHT